MFKNNEGAPSIKDEMDKLDQAEKRTVAEKEAAAAREQRIVANIGSSRQQYEEMMKTPEGRLRIRAYYIASARADAVEAGKDYKFSIPLNASGRHRDVVVTDYDLKLAEKAEAELKNPVQERAHEDALRVEAAHKELISRVDKAKQELAVFEKEWLGRDSENKG